MIKDLRSKALLQSSRFPEQIHCISYKRIFPFKPLATVVQLITNRRLGETKLSTKQKLCTLVIPIYSMVNIIICCLMVLPSNVSIEYRLTAFPTQAGIANFSQAQLKKLVGRIRIANGYHRLLVRNRLLTELAHRFPYVDLLQNNPNILIVSYIF